MQEDELEGNMAMYWCAAEIKGQLSLTADGTAFRPAMVMLQDSGASLSAISTANYMAHFAHLPLEEWPLTEVQVGNGASTHPLGMV